MELGGSSRALRGGMLLAIVLVATGCASEKPMPVPTQAAYTSTYEAPEPMAIAPLTGMPVPVGALLTPSIAAKIDNHPDARPQVGLEHTDIVFEELVEGGLSRYVAVWQSDVPAEIGPVRSIRPMDPDIISPLGGIVTYSGGQERFVAAMQSAPVFNLVHGSGGTDDLFYRTDAKESPHDVLVRAPLVIGQHTDLAPPPQQFAYSLDAASSTGSKDGVPIARIDLVIGGAATPSWGWDAASGKWLRFMTGGAPDTDSAGAQLGAANVIVLRVGVSYDRGIPKTELVGSGEAWIATNGGVVHASWSKGSMTDRIRLVDGNGVTIRLAPGNTWIELVPLDGAANFTAPPAA